MESDVKATAKLVADLEFRRMFSDPMDPNNCFIDLNAGQGGRYTRHEGFRCVGGLECIGLTPPIATNCCSACGI